MVYYFRISWHKQDIGLPTIRGYFDDDDDTGHFPIRTKNVGLECTCIIGYSELETNTGIGLFRGYNAGQWIEAPPFT